VKNTSNDDDNKTIKRSFLIVQEIHPRRKAANDFFWTFRGDSAIYNLRPTLRFKNSQPV
jgi:hypothetical protein